MIRSALLTFLTMASFVIFFWLVVSVDWFFPAVLMFCLVILFMITCYGVFQEFEHRRMEKERTNKITADIFKDMDEQIARLRAAVEEAERKHNL